MIWAAKTTGETTCLCGFDGLGGRVEVTRRKGGDHIALGTVYLDECHWGHLDLLPHEAKELGRLLISMADTVSKP